MLREIRHGFVVAADILRQSNNVIGQMKFGLKLYMKESHSFIQPYLFIMPFNAAGIGHIPHLYAAALSETPANQARRGGSSFDENTVLGALSLRLGGPLTATGFPGIPVSGEINAALCENGTFLLLHPEDGSSSRTLDVVWRRNSRHLSVVGILLPDDHNLLFRAVATARQLERDCGFVQAARDDEVLALRRTIAHQLDEWHAREQAYVRPHYISQHDANTAAISALHLRQPAAITRPGFHVEAHRPATHSVIPTAPPPGVWRPF